MFQMDPSDNALQSQLQTPVYEELGHQDYAGGKEGLQPCQLHGSVDIKQQAHVHVLASLAWGFRM